MNEMTDILALTSQIVSAHVSRNTVPADQLPDLVRRVHNALFNVARAPDSATTAEPAVPVKTSVKPDALICLCCGKPFKMLKRHLMSDHKITPQQYRAMWSLPPTYPIVAPNYAKTRSTLAKKIGLGTRRGTGRAAPKRRTMR